MELPQPGPVGLSFCLSSRPPSPATPCHRPRRRMCGSSRMSAAPTRSSSASSHKSSSGSTCRLGSRALHGPHPWGHPRPPSLPVSLLCRSWTAPQRKVSTGQAPLVPPLAFRYANSVLFCPLIFQAPGIWGSGIWRITSYSRKERELKSPLLTRSPSS